MKYLESNKELREILAEDSVEDLVKIYNELRISHKGQMISDVSLCYEELTDWIKTEEADLLIPYTYSHQTKEPRGGRIWYLSQKKFQTTYYYGQFFDLKVSKTTKRLCRVMCRLSAEAVKFFKSYPQVQYNEEI